MRLVCNSLSKTGKIDEAKAYLQIALERYSDNKHVAAFAIEFYKELKKQYEPDIVCFDRIVVELKAVSGITDEHRAQLINYLRGMRMKLGLLVHYGRCGGLEHERIVL